jgi:hypothetical protein
MNRDTDNIPLGDRYVKFQCQNLRGYDAAFAELPKHPDLSIEELCSSPVKTWERPRSDIGFLPNEFSIDPQWEPHHKDQNGLPDGSRHPYTPSKRRAYDKNSIMHYTSLQGAKDVVSLETVHNVPLIAWRQRGKNFQPPDQVTDQNAFVMHSNYARGPSNGNL